MKNRIATSLLRLILPTVLFCNVQVGASFGIGPFGKWKVENANSYIIYNGIYIPNPEQMIDPGSILDSLNPVSSISNLWKAVPSFNIFGGGGDDQYSSQYAQYGDQYGADASTYPSSYDSPQPSGSEPMSTIVSPDQSASSAGLSSLFGFGGGSDIPVDPAAPVAVDDSGASSGGFSSYLPWNWFGGNSRSSAQLGGGNQLPDEFSFLLDGPFQVNRRSDISPVADHTHLAEKEKVSVYLRPIGQGSFLRYELHEPIADTAEVNVKAPKQQAAPPAPTPSGRKKRSVPDEELKRTPSKYVPRKFRKPAPPTPPGLPARKKSSVQFNRRRYQQLQKQKKHFKSSSRRSPLSTSSKSQKIKKSDDKVTDMDADFPCPKIGIWHYNGEVCIATGPTPTWACKPNDLVASGKLVICRNKILMS